MIYYHALRQNKITFPQEAFDKVANGREIFQDTNLKLVSDVGIKINKLTLKYNLVGNF